MTSWQAPQVYEFTPFGAIDHVHTLLTRWASSTQVIVVAERFVFTSAKHTSQTSALEIIGALRYLSRINVATFELQSRSVKSRVPNSMLIHRVGWWLVNSKGDGNDATRHLLVALARHRPDHEAVRQLTGKMESTKK